MSTSQQLPFFAPGYLRTSRSFHEGHHDTLEQESADLAFRSSSHPFAFDVLSDSFLFLESRNQRQPSPDVVVDILASVLKLVEFAFLLLHNT